MKMLHEGQKWNQAELQPQHELNDGLFSIIVFDDQRRPRPIGTGFILAIFSDGAVGCTAAHNFARIRQIQTPKQRHHASALAEFLPNATNIDLDRKKVRAICVSGSDIEMATIGWAVWDESSDIAFFSLLPQHHSATSTFQSRFELETTEPRLFAEVVALGYKDMSVENEVRDGKGFESFQIRHQLVMRCGRVSAIHLDGQRLCKGPCVETTIPVFPGMSGGPVFLAGTHEGPMRPFGLISSDPTDEASNKSDRSVPGSSIVPLIGAQVTMTGDGRSTTLLRLNDAIGAANQADT